MFKALVHAGSDDKARECVCVSVSVGISAKCSCWSSLSFPNDEKPYAKTFVSTVFHYKRLQMPLVPICFLYFDLAHSRLLPQTIVSSITQFSLLRILRILVYFKMLWYSNTLCISFVCCFFFFSACGFFFFHPSPSRPVLPLWLRVLKKQPAQLL